MTQQVKCACGRTDEHLALSKGAARAARQRFACSPSRVAQRWLDAAAFQEAKGNKQVAAGYRAQATRALYG